MTVSQNHPYLFTCSDDKTVQCWDLETNQSIRSYHGHLSGVLSIAAHPSLDILVSGARDATARVWDMRTLRQVHAFSHSNAVSSILTQDYDP